MRKHKSITVMRKHKLRKRDIFQMTVTFRVLWFSCLLMQCMLKNRVCIWNSKMKTRECLWLMFFYLLLWKFQVLSNGILHSAIHRVALNTKRSRYATIYFYGIDNAVPLRVPPQLVTKDRPLKYRPFTVNEYREYLVKRQLSVDSVKALEIRPGDTVDCVTDFVQ